MTELLGHLFLGTEKEAVRADLLLENGITHLLGVAGPFRPPQGVSVESLAISLTIQSEGSIEEPIKKSFDFIENAKENNGKALLFCQFAQNRSPTIAVSYLMLSQQWSLYQAFQYVLSRKCDVDPHQNYLKQLKDLEDRQRELSP